MPVVLISGGTGLIGTHLSAMLQEKGYEVIILSREAGLGHAVWDIRANKIDMDAIARADFIIHLAGASVAEKRWTKNRKKEILNSRTESSALLIRALKETNNHVKAFISASAIGWYGPDTSISKKNGFVENEPASTDFLGDTCKLWEASTDPVKDMGIRLVKFRTGIVLSKDGGALDSFEKPINAGIAAVLGNGKQVISWIHIKDLCRMYIYAMENENMHGIYNAVNPSPVTNESFMLALAKKIKGKFFIPFHIPSFILKIVLGEMSVEVLKSATVSCAKIKSENFLFLFPSLDAALADLIN